MISLDEIQFYRPPLAQLRPPSAFRGHSDDTASQRKPVDLASAGYAGSRQSNPHDITSALLEMLQESFPPSTSAEPVSPATSNTPGPPVTRDAEDVFVERQIPGAEPDFALAAGVLHASSENPAKNAVCHLSAGRRARSEASEGLMAGSEHGRGSTKAPAENSTCSRMSSQDVVIAPLPPSVRFLDLTGECRDWGSVEVLDLTESRDSSPEITAL